MTLPQQSKTRYEVITQVGSDGVLLPIPMVLLRELGWKEGDKVSVVMDEQGRYILKKS